MRRGAGLGAALACEALKARRSRVPVAVALGFSLMPAVAALFMVILEDPERARDWGLISAKAHLFAGTADWPTFLAVIAQGVAVGGLLLFAVVAAWIFGREFSDRTVKNLLAVPTPRGATVAAKLLVTAGLGALVSAWVVALGLALGAAIGLPGGDAGTLAAGLLRIGLVALLSIALTTPVALAASAGRGYLAPLAFALSTLFLAQIVAATGWGEWFPWSVPALYSGAAGPEAAAMGPASFLLVAAVSALGAALTAWWWRSADQTT